MSNILDHILFLHVFFECNTTSNTLFNKSKTAALEWWKKDRTWKCSSGFHQDWYYSCIVTSNGIRFSSQSITLLLKFILITIAILAHPLKTQLSSSISLFSNTKKKWSWMLKVTILWLKNNIRTFTPYCLLKMIFCKYTKNCRPLCDCRRLRLNRSPVCCN